jgi:hypothetical protein
MAKKLILDVDSDLWTKYKGLVTKDISLHDSVVMLIKKEVERNEV